MNIVTNDTQQIDLGSTNPAAVEENIRTQVWSVLGALYPRGGQVERRTEQRYPYPYLIHLTPVGTEDLTPIGDPVVVVGKHLSEGGLGFYHPKPLPHRHMIVELTSPDGSTKHFLIDLTWCRFTEQGWYESGGRFLQALESEEATGQNSDDVQ